MKKCMNCGNKVSKMNHDLCYTCWTQREHKENELTTEDHFESNLLNNKIYTVYIMFYQDKEKIGYTNDLNSRLIEIKREFPNNKLVYFREFPKEIEARRFEAWLKKLPKRGLTKFIADFQDKLKKVDRL